MIDKPIKDINSDFDEPDYNSYRGIDRINNFTQSFGNSFYFYFGTKPNSTALELMNSKYFTSCTKLFKNLIIINGDIDDVSTVDGSDGSITISVQGGTEPYTYLWSNGEITKDVSDLVEGSYYVIVTDDNGRESKKTFIVRGLKTLIADVITKNSVTVASSNGEIIIKSIIGGIGPYNIRIIGVSVDIQHNDVTYSLTEKDLAVGNYQVTIVDKNLDFLVHDVTISVPAELNIINIASSSPTCYDFENGELSFTIQGGTPEFLTVVEHLESGITYSTNNLTNLVGGTYIINVTDSFDQSATSSNIILIDPDEIVLSINGSTLSFGPTINGDSYDLLLDGGFVRTLTGNGGTVTTQADAGSGVYQIEINETCITNGISV